MNDAPGPDGRVFEVTKTCAFDAAHRLPAGPPGGLYTRLHGHSFSVQATVRGPARTPVGWVEDLGELDAALKAICADLDHSLLNDHEGLASPTLEALCAYFAQRLETVFPTLARIAVSRPTNGESCSIDLLAG